MIVQESSIHLLSDEERRTLDDYDAIFEKYSLFCNGRWLGAQILQDSQDLMYLQHIVYMKKPDVIIETGRCEVIPLQESMIVKDLLGRAFCLRGRHSQRPR